MVRVLFLKAGAGVNFTEELSLSQSTIFLGVRYKGMCASHHLCLMIFRELNYFFTALKSLQYLASGKTLMH